MIIIITIIIIILRIAIFNFQWTYVDDFNASDWLAANKVAQVIANAKKPELTAFIVGRNIYRISSSPPFVNNWNSGKQIIALFICCGCCVL